MNRKQSTYKQCDKNDKSDSVASEGSEGSGDNRHQARLLESRVHVSLRCVSNIIM